MANYIVKAFPKYSEDHLWVRKMPDGRYLIGITDYAQQQQGAIVYADLPDEGDLLTQFESFGSIESGKTVSELIAPVSGTVTGVNEELADDPALINNACYDSGWLVAVEPDNFEEDAAKLMDAEAYKAFIETL